MKDMISKNRKAGKLKVTDINGFVLTVTDLPDAIAQAGRFREYRHIDKAFSEFDQRQQLYWNDLHERLLNLRQSLQTNQNLES